jgi:transposase
LLSDQERVTLRTWARSRSEPQRLVQRSQIILLAAEGVENQKIAEQLRTSRPTVQLWRERFLALRTSGLEKDGNLHLIVDNYGTHKHPSVERWLRRHPRFHLHFTPTSCSWLNLVERWFRNLTEQRLRRGSFRNVKELIEAIRDYISGHNQNPRIFVWSASVERILAKVAKCKEALDALH